MKVTSLDTSKFFKPQIVMLVVVGVASVLSGIAPASRVVWFTEMFWAWGLVAILILTWRRFRFSTAAIDGGEAGAAFLGSQGDEWDAQKDILCDTFGAVCSVVLLLIFSRNPRSAVNDCVNGNGKAKEGGL